MRRHFVSLTLAIAIILLCTCGYSQADIDRERRAGYADGYSEGLEDGRDKAVNEVRVNFAWIVALPVLITTLLAGIIISLLGWRTTGAIVTLYRQINLSLKVRKRAFRNAITAAPGATTGTDLAIPRVPFLLLTLALVAAAVYIARVELLIVVAMLAIGLFAGMYATRFSWLITLRLVVFWLVTASFVLATWYSPDGQWIRELAAVGVVLMPLYFFIRALFGSGWNGGWQGKWNPSNTSEAWERGFTIAAVCGTTTCAASVGT